MTVIRDNYIKEMFALSRVSLEQWQRFVEAYRLLTLEHVEQMLSAPSSEIKMAVGRAREALYRLEEMQKVEELNKKVTNK